MSFAAKKCVPAKGAPALSNEQVESYLKELPGWGLCADGKAIQRKFQFGNFVEALAFVNKVGEIAEAEGHHPDFELGWGYVNIKLTTHDVGGLHDNDFVVATKINQVL